MRIERRDPTLKYPRAVREEKLRLVLDWLLEFQFSSVELLAQRLDLTSHSSYKFFRALLDAQIIQQFKSAHTHQARYVMLTKAGGATCCRSPAATWSTPIPTPPG